MISVETVRIAVNPVGGEAKIPTKAADLLANATFYHYSRQCLTGGMPFREFIHLGGLDDPRCRVADIGCGPADILRFVDDDAKPGYYLGIDMSTTYLAAAQARAAARRIAATFAVMDLENLVSDAKVQRQLLEALVQHQVTNVLLMGVLHHISDEAAKLTLNLIGEAPSVTTITTQDVVTIPGHGLNNFLCGLDRGQHVRDESGYRALISQTAWKNCEVVWTRTGVRFIHYINHRLTR